MKRHVYLPDRTVVVEDGTVRDLDGNTLGFVAQLDAATWSYRPFDAVSTEPRCRFFLAAITGLLADPRTPAGGPNRFDRPR